MEITEANLEKIVNEQLISALALVTPDGKPHCTPVWVHHYQGYLYVFSKTGRAKERYARENPNCMIAFNYASLRGTIEIIEKGEEEYMRIYDLPDQRYGSDPHLNSYKLNWDILFKITPSKIYR